MRPVRCVSGSTRLPLAVLLLGTLGVGLSAVSSATEPPAAGRPPEVLEASDVGGLEADSAALVLSGQEGGDLAASVLVVPWPGPNPDLTRLALVVDLDRASLLAPGGGRSGGGEGDGADGAGPTGTESEERREKPEDTRFVTEVHAYALGPENTLGAHFTQAFALDRARLTGAGADRAGAELAGAISGVKFFGALDVPPGGWSIRVLVRQRRNGRVALRAIPVTAPSFAAGASDRPLLLPPLVPEPPERWVLVRQGGAREASSPAPFPLVFEEEVAETGASETGSAEEGGLSEGSPSQPQRVSRERWLVPSTQPVVEAGGRAVYLAGRGLPDPGSGWRVTAREPGAGPAEPATEASPETTPDTTPPDTAPPDAAPPDTAPPDTAQPGSDVRPGDAATAGALQVTRRVGASLGLELLEARLDPAGLPAGVRELEIAAPGGAVASLLAVLIPPGMAVAERPPGVPAGALLWPDLLRRSSSASSPPSERLARATETVEIGDEELARFQVAYLDALGPLTTGDRSAALRAVGKVERSGLARGTATDVLARGQLQVALDVSGGSIGRLLPLIQLHEDLYRRYRQQDQPALAAHTRRVAEALVELYVQRGEGRASSRERRRLAAAALVSLAGEALEYRNSQEAMRLLARALEHEPDSSAALLILAVRYELMGEYSEAVSLLRRLQEHAPADRSVAAEGHLRLGVNLARVGSKRAAEQRLRECLTPDRPRWVRAVAYQELAVLLADQGRLEEAARWLEEALDRMPRQQRIAIQLAALYESLGRPTEARAVLGRLERKIRRGVGRDQDSPRLRYSQWPDEAIEASRQRLQRAAAAQMPALAEALKRFTARGG